ncbi:DUF418 domain-containing protein [Kribbella sp. VKM Ac-2568]|uniref:DUF418 domain-containing protein n=1 Tax=Kribbella sp. VKM Ac-2568 TaxID=2512219 RepID=UPI0010DF98B0|nr:DUF418 domain-containing protein [Kribbella sp. VKM Ac-2568]TCM50273.1 putative membrane protein YeiB [Kribbella sp. VKM Ac-2568]
MVQVAERVGGWRGPVTGRERALAPDLIRGAMLLLIGLANAANFAFAGQPGLNGDPHGLERILNFLKTTLVDARAYPVFAVMFGYGLVQLARRQQNAGTTASGVRKILLKRNGWLVAFGLAHATLLYFGDFLGAYGIVGILCTLLLLNRGDKFHQIILWIWGAQVVYTIVAAGLAVLAIANTSGPAHAMTDSPNPSLAATSYGAGLVDRLHEYPLHTATVLGFIVIVWLGIWAARKQMLENPLAHRTLLIRVAAACMGITVLGGLPLALVSAGWLHVDAAAVDAMSFLHNISGQFGGPGYIALFALLVGKLTANRRPDQLSLPITAISALGQRSMSGYLLQSIAWMLLLAPFTLNLGDRLGNTAFTAAGAAIAVWTISVIGAYQMTKQSYRGPAETLLRRLTY